MELSASKVSTGAFATHRRATSQSHGVTCSLSKSVLHCKSCPTVPQNKLQQIGNGCLSNAKVFLSDERLWGIHEKATNVVVSQRSSLICQSTRSPRTKGKERSQTSSKIVSRVSARIGGEEEQASMDERSIHSTLGLADACKFVQNDARYVNERARNDIVLLSRGIMSLDARARKDVAIIGSEFLKLDARAREDTMKIDSDVKMKAERLRHITTILKDRAQSKLEKAAAKHWSDGALKDDLRRADFRAKQRAMEDALMALEKIMSDLVSVFPTISSLSQQNDPLMADRMMGLITLEKNGRTSDIFPGEVSSDRIAAIQDAYFSMASALSEADGIDYSDPEELELLITTLIDLDAMDGKTSVTLLAECSSSPDESTRKALANALAAAPSMWALGNAGMGALQRLAEDKNPAIAAAASNTIYELKKQWEIEEGDNWRFMVNLKPEEYEGDIPEGDDSS
ncbi:Senescence-associated protein SPA15, chloroplastic [Linum perenne]